MRFYFVSVLDGDGEQLLETLVQASSVQQARKQFGRWLSDWADEPLIQSTEDHDGYAVRMNVLRRFDAHGVADFGPETWVYYNPEDAV